MDDSSESIELPPESHVGTVTLRVASLPTLVPFYERVIGLTRVDDGGRVADLASGPDEPPILRLREMPDAAPRPPEAAGLFHHAIRVPDRPALADALRRLRNEGVRLTGASDHLVSEALYLRDPAGNGIELYRDRPREAWTETDDGVEMATEPLDLEALAAERTADEPGTVPAEATMGHVHLEITDLDRSANFYRDRVGLNVRATWDGARFLAAGSYHHHVGLNVWNGRTEPLGDHRGIEGFELVVPDRDALDAVADAAEAETCDGRGRLVDPDGIDVAFVAASERS